VDNHSNFANNPKNMKTFNLFPPDVLSIQAIASHFDKYEAIESGDYFDHGIHIELACDQDSSARNLTRAILKTDTCTVTIPELDTEISPGKAKYCTIKDLFEEVQDNLLSAFGRGGSSSVQQRQFLDKLENILKGLSGFSITLDDPLGNSIIQCKPEGEYEEHLNGLELYEHDPFVTCKTYTRTRIDADDLDIELDELVPITQYTGEEGIQKLVELLRNAKKIVGMTGAGVSTESGIPAFRNDMSNDRNAQTIWSKWDPTELVFSRIMSDESVRLKYWDMHEMLHSIIEKVEPNASHQFFKYLYDQGKLLKLITQNIDGLHQRAGLPDDVVCEIHGTTHKVSCYKCHRLYNNINELHRRYRDKEYDGSGVPYCDDCGPSGILKHATISFGESLEPTSIRAAMKASSECDLMIVMGTSLVVAPANQLPLLAVKHGMPLVILNLGKTPLDAECTVLVHEKSGETCQRLLDILQT
jgi:NAD-dependent deacetylase